MTFCGNCGAQVQDGVKFCPSCGKEVTANPAQQAQPQQQQYQQARQHTVPPNDAEANKMMAVLAYILFFIPLLTGDQKKSPFVKFHANQGTVLFIVMAAWGVVYWIITAILTAALFNPYTWTGGGLGFYSVITTILGLVWIVPAVLCVIGIINAVTGKTKPLPVIGRFKIIK